MLTYFKILAFIAFIAVQFLFLLPYTISSNEWYEFGLGWFIIFVLDPLVFYAVYKRVKSQWSPE